MAINNAHTILKNYRKKINDANQYKEYLPLVGQQIIERYKNNSDNYKTLLDEAADSKSFFIGMEDETLISYVNTCDRLNNIFDLNVSESKKINGFVDENFVVRSAEEVITGIRTVEIGRKVEYKLGTADKLQEDMKLFNRYYIEWEVEDVDNNFSTEHNKAEAVTENIIDFFDNNFSNPYDRTFEAVKEGRYIIKAKVHDKFDCNEIVDIIDFEQIVEHGDDSIISMEFKEKILEALKLTDWSIKIDFVAFSQALVKATVALCFLGGLSTVAPEVTLLIIALIAAGTKLKATFDTIRGIVVIVEALTLIEKARSKRALQVGGQKIKEGLLYLGEGALEFIIAKCTMRNVANARIQVLRNVTPQPQALPQTALPAPNVAGALPVKATTGLPAINATAEEVTLLMNKSAIQAMENVAEMAVVQSEKVELQEMVSEVPLNDSASENSLVKKVVKENEAAYQTYEQLKVQNQVNLLQSITDEADMTEALTFVKNKPRATALMIESASVTKPENPMKILKAIKGAEPEALDKYKKMATVWNKLQSVTYNDYTQATKIIQSLVSNIQALNDNERLAISILIAEGNPAVSTDVFIRVQANNKYPTLYGATPFVYASNPMLLAGQKSNMSGFRQAVGIDDAESKETYVDFIVCKDSAASKAIASSIYTDKIEMGVEKYIENLVNNFNNGECKYLYDVKALMSDFKIQLFEIKDGKYIVNKKSIKEFSDKYINSLNYRRPGENAVASLIDSGYINVSEKRAFESAYKLIQWGANANEYYSADIFTITPKGQVGSVEYGIKKADFNNTYDINTINTTNDKVKIFRARIDNTSGKVECFDVGGTK